MYLDECNKNNTSFVITNSQMVQDGEQFTVYGICVKTTFGEVYCCEDVSCSEEDVRELVNRLKQAPFLFEELPYLVEDYISFLSEYTE